MKALLQIILAELTKATLRRYKPIIVGITGSVGKTSTKEAIFTVLRARHRVRRSEKNYNTEIGVPLTILGIPHCGRNIPKWLFALIRSFIRVLIRERQYPEILALEMAADRPGDIEYLARLARPKIGIITAIGEIPVHVEFFAGPRAIAEEKSKLIQALPREGVAVLNYDDSAVMEIKNRTLARVITYGFGEGADVRITSYESHISFIVSALHNFLRPSKNARRDDRPGIGFTLEHNGSGAGVRLFNTFGKQQAYAAAAAAAVGLGLKMELGEIASSLAAYESPPGRLKLIKGNKNTIILDDTYNASPASTLAALEVLEQFPAKRRIAVLGDMLELGSWTEEAHRMIGQRVAEVADLFVAVGERMKFSLEEVRSKGKKALWFAAAEETGRALESMLEPGDIILVKGSQSMRMEKVVYEIMQEPERADELLVRQTVDWLRG